MGTRSNHWNFLKRGPFLPFLNPPGFPRNIPQSHGSVEPFAAVISCSRNGPMIRRFFFWKLHVPWRIHGIGIFTDPWMVDFHGLHVGEYTSPMDPMGVACDVKEITFLIEHKGFTCSVNEGPGCLWAFLPKNPTVLYLIFDPSMDFLAVQEWKEWPFLLQSGSFHKQYWSIAAQMIGWFSFDGWNKPTYDPYIYIYLYIHIYTCSICILYVLVYIQGCIQIYIVMDVYSYIDGYIWFL